jgi:predicted thioredoxin/glutaredoxin
MLFSGRILQAAGAAAIPVSSRAMIREYCDDIEVKYIDATEDPGTVEKYSIMAVPTIVIDGEVAFVGAPSSEQLESYLREKLNR